MILGSSDEIVVSFAFVRQASLAIEKKIPPFPLIPTPAWPSTKNGPCDVGYSRCARILSPQRH